MPGEWMRFGSTLIAAMSLAGICLLALPRASFSQAQESVPIANGAVDLPDAPEPTASVLAAIVPKSRSEESSSSAELSLPSDLSSSLDLMQNGPSTVDTNHGDPTRKKHSEIQVDANGNPIPLNRRQPQRILGFMPNFRSVSDGAKPHPPGWKYNFTIATRQATDYSSFIFLGITSLTAEGMNMHPVFGKGIGGLYTYTWHGFLDKTDGTYISAFFLSSLIHEDTRYYALGNERSIPIRALYVISRQGVTRTYGGHQTPNIAGLGGKVLTQLVSRTYYPASAATFSVLATKFGYSAMRDIAFTAIREFYPDAAAYFVRKHRERLARREAERAASALVSQ